MLLDSGHTLLITDAEEQVVQDVLVAGLTRPHRRRLVVEHPPAPLVLAAPRGPTGVAPRGPARLPVHVGTCPRHSLVAGRVAPLVAQGLAPINPPEGAGNLTRESVALAVERAARDTASGPAHMVVWRLPRVTACLRAIVPAELVAVTSANVSAAPRGGPTSCSADVATRGPHYEDLREGAPDSSCTP